MKRTKASPSVAPALPCSLADLAQALVAAVAQEARKRSTRVCVAVVDSGGHLVAFLRMDGLPFHLVAISQDKAITAASFGKSTSELALALGRHSRQVTEFFRDREHLVLLAGGLPLRVGGTLLGGIGVSGASETEDEACAMAALSLCLPSPASSATSS